VRTRVLHPSWAGGLLAAAAFAWWATGLRPFTDPPLVTVPLSGLGAMALGARWLPARTPAAAARRPLLWGVLALALAAWQLAAFVQQPRQEHPTLSSLANALFGDRPIRAIAFLLWLAGAAALARR
jgi:hypothetical protein